MNNDLISRSKLIETIIDPLNVNDAAKNDWYEGYYQAKNEDVEIIKAQQPVDAIVTTVEPNQLTQDLINKVNVNVGLAQPIKDEEPQGKWIGNAFGEHHCNRCGHPALWEEEPDDYYEVQSKFCPNCGARLENSEE